MSSSWTIKTALGAAVLVLWMPWVASAQTTTAQILPKQNSPYSRFGLGDLFSSALVSQTGMAGMGIAVRDASHTNWLNPAALSALEVAGFELGVSAKYSALSDGDQKDDAFSGNLRQISLAFPLNNSINRAQERKKHNFNWGMGFHLSPYSEVGYNIQNVEIRGETLDRITTDLKGSGGTYKLGFGNGVRIGNLSLGAELQALFGKVANSRGVYLDSVALAYSTDLQDDISYRSTVFKLGAQYVINLDKPNERGIRDIGDRSFIFGFTYTPNSNLKSVSSRLYRRLSPNTSVSDTITYEADIERGGTLPSEMGFGLTYESLGKLRISAEYLKTRWSEYLNEAKIESLSDSRRMAFGLEFIPDVQSYNNNWSRSRYRLGVFHAQDARSNNGQQLTNYGVTLGVGIPIILPRQTLSFVNLALEAGRFGAVEGLKETYVQFHFGFTLNDSSWFFKRKFN